MTGPPLGAALRALADAEQRRAASAAQAQERWQDDAQRRFWSQTLDELDRNARSYQQALQELDRELVQALSSIS